MSDLLIIDTGHTQIKCSHYVDRQVERQATPVTPFTWPDDIESPHEILVMGTNDRLQQRVCAHLAHLSWNKPMVLGRDISAPIEHATLAESTGNDRLANALGAKQLFPGNSCLIVSAGSALVSDIVTSSGEFIGGSIGIGLERYRQAMRDISPRLETHDEANLNYPAKNSPNAVWQGWYLPTLSHIESLRNNHNVGTLILTGGDADALKVHLNAAEVMPHLGADAMARALGYYD